MIFTKKNQILMKDECHNDIETIFSVLKILLAERINHHWGRNRHGGLTVAPARAYFSLVAWRGKDRMPGSRANYSVVSFIFQKG